MVGGEWVLRDGAHLHVDLRDVMVGGEWVLRDGAHLHVDLRDVEREIWERLVKVRSAGLAGGA